MATTFDKTANNIHTTLSSAYVAGSGSMSVASTAGMPATPFRISVGNAIYRVTTVSGTTLTIGSSIEGTVDAALPSGTDVWMYFTSGHYQDHSTAINTLQNAPQSTPGGSTGQVQYNNNSSFAAANLYWNGSNNRIGVGAANTPGVLTIQCQHGVGGIVLAGTDNSTDNGGTGNSNPDVGVALILSCTLQNNRQLLYFDSSQVGDSTKVGFRFLVGTDLPFIDGVNGDVSAQRNFSLGGSNCSIGIGFPPASSQSVVQAQLHVADQNPSRVAFQVQGAWSQTADLVQHTNIYGNVLSGVSSDGYMRSVVGNGAPGASPADGSMYVDNQNGNFYVRIQGVWKKATLS